MKILKSKVTGTLVTMKFKVGDIVKLRKIATEHWPDEYKGYAVVKAIVGDDSFYKNIDLIITDKHDKINEYWFESAYKEIFNDELEKIVNE